jgi:hypothetical protein
MALFSQEAEARALWRVRSGHLATISGILNAFQASSRSNMSVSSYNFNSAKIQ